MKLVMLMQLTYIIKMTIKSSTFIKPAPLILGGFFLTLKLWTLGEKDVKIYSNGNQIEISGEIS